MKRIKYSIAIWLFFYLGISFILAELNPMEWKQEIRFWFVVFAAFSNVMVVTYPGFNETA